MTAREGASETVSFVDHCREAMRKFVMNAVVIDNEPVLSDSDKGNKNAAKKAVAVDTGMGDPEENEERQATIEKEEDDEGPTAIDQSLNIRSLSDAFANESINCAFVLPDDESQGKEAILKRVVTAAQQSDIVVIDWYLINNDPTLTLDILRYIAEQDVADRGRLRFICI